MNDDDIDFTTNIVIVDQDGEVFTFPAKEVRYVERSHPARIALHFKDRTAYIPWSSIGELSIPRTEETD